MHRRTCSTGLRFLVASERLKGLRPDRIRTSPHCPILHPRYPLLEHQRQSSMSHASCNMRTSGARLKDVLSLAWRWTSPSSLPNEWARLFWVQSPMVKSQYSSDRAISHPHQENQRCPVQGGSLLVLAYPELIYRADSQFFRIFSRSPDWPFSCLQTIAQRLLSDLCTDIFSLSSGIYNP